jgi:hypothetical protein
MKSTDLIRWGGLAAMLAGVAWAASGIVHFVMVYPEAGAGPWDRLPCTSSNRPTPLPRRACLGHSWDSAFGRLRLTDGWGQRGS